MKNNSFFNSFKNLKKMASSCFSMVKKGSKDISSLPWNKLDARGYAFLIAQTLILVALLVLLILKII